MLVHALFWRQGLWPPASTPTRHPTSVTKGRYVSGDPRILHDVSPPDPESVHARLDNAATADDAGLTAHAQLGDGEAFGRLVAPHLARALQLARRVLRNPADAEDLVQDAVLRAFERIAQYDRARPFAPWFFRLLFRLGLHRKESLALREMDDLDDDLTPSDDVGSDPVEQSEFWRAFELAVARLPGRQRTILLLFEVDGYSGPEIAELLEIAPETVRWHLHAARKSVRPALQRFRSESNLSL